MAHLSSDLCIKCNICTSACPVAAVTDLFPGPKAVGPQAQRFRHPNLPSPDHSLDYCSGCGVCSLVCPHGVFSRQTFRSWFNKSEMSQQVIGLRKVAYFHGCAANYYEPRVAAAAMEVLKRNSIKVVLPEQNCCGLPMQSNGDFSSARKLARANVKSLASWVREGYAIVGHSTSCTLALKHEYQAILGIEGEEAELVAKNTYDIFEYLQMLDDEGLLNTRFIQREEKVLYHAPCQQRTHGFGRPAADFMRRFGFTVTESRTDCCGVAGTYGLKTGKYEIAEAVGKNLFEQIAEVNPQRVVCDSETCRWWIEAQTGKKTVHPIEIMAEAYRGRRSN
ncbi:MAG: anaerobic glycerol-3-phosphate dehydrogenase subunit C [Chloroflexi bacterium]|nr:anaerobic glycerol-3-phosphate dehydrogenase subunit C [Chloroflexota bacterium]